MRGVLDHGGRARQGKAVVGESVAGFASRTGELHCERQADSYCRMVSSLTTWDPQLRDAMHHGARLRLWWKICLQLTSSFSS